MVSESRISLRNANEYPVNLIVLINLWNTIPELWLGSLKVYEEYKLSHADTCHEIKLFR
jgi:hypothetical protein